MVIMAYDGYLQLCDVTESHYLALYESVMKQPVSPPSPTDLYRRSPRPEHLFTEDRPRGSDDGDSGLGDGDPALEGESPPRDIRCKWDCNLDNDDDDVETILTSPTTVSRQLHAYKA